jgi:hypothetical protein
MNNFYLLGYIPQKYVPLYVRTTLMESNGTSPGGDQTYDTMAKDRRYSNLLGRAMASLEPVPFAKKKIKPKVDTVPEIISNKKATLIKLGTSRNLASG